MTPSPRFPVSPRLRRSVSPCLLAVLFAAVPFARAEESGPPSAPPGSGGAGLVPVSGGPAGGESDKAVDPRKEEVLAKLDNLKITLEFSNASLEDVISFIRDFSGIDFVIDPKVKERLTEEQLKISFKVTNIPLRTALKLMLSGKNLSAVYRDGVLVIVPKDEIDKDVVMRIYDVRDLLMKIQDFEGPTIELRPPSAAGGAIGGSILMPDESPKPLTEDFIIDMVKKNCAPESWDQNPNAQISLNNGLLIVVQSKRAHTEIHQLIGLLRQYK